MWLPAVHPVAVLIYAPLAFIGTLPIFVLRKQTLTSEQSDLWSCHPDRRGANTDVRLPFPAALPATPTRFSQLALLRQPSAAFTLAAYLIASVPLSFAYLWCAASVSPNARLGWVFSQQA